MRGWILRNWYRLFHKSRVYQIRFSGDPAFRVGDIVVTSDKVASMCLGKGYFLMLKNQKYVPK